MRKKTAAGPVGEVNPLLGPMVDRIIQDEFGKVLGDLETLIATRVREQLWAAIGASLKGTGPAPAPVVTPRRKVARAAAPAPRAAKAEAAARVRGGEKPCNVLGCNRPHRSQGYCGAHYQSARKYDWPKPCPEGFDPPVRKRGRPAKSAVVPAAPSAGPDDGITDLKSLLGD